MVEWESILERDAILLFEYNPLVIRYQEQPSIEYYYDQRGKIRKCVPDFLLELADDSCLLVEVKPSSKVSKKAISNKLAAIAKRLHEQGRRYRVLTEQDIRRQPLYGNLTKLHKSAKRAKNLTTIEELTSNLPAGTAWPLKDVADHLGSEHHALQLICADKLRFDFEAALADEALVWLKNFDGGRNDSFCI